MSSAGHVLDMINRIKQNRLLKEAKRARYAKVKGANSKNSANHVATVDKNHLPAAELNLLKQKIRRGILKDRRRAIVITMLSLVIGIILVSIYLHTQ